jgi:uncharacterized protein YecE (DUF72 family)
VRIGISGWRYTPWRGVFYPKGLPQRCELQYVASKMNSLELNGSFYSLQYPSSYQHWYEATPPGFLFSAKGSRFITHMLKLNNVETPLANFFASGILRLGEKLGPLLWQFPPQLQCDLERFEKFFRMLPRTGDAAVKLARKHDARLKGRSWLKADAIGELRHCVEIRHESFRCSDFIDLLREHNIALVVADTAGKFPYMEDITADFVYARLHGDIELYASGYSDEALDRWAKRVQLWRAGKQPKDAALSSPSIRTTKPRDVYVYFDNDAKIRAPFDALGLASRIGIKWEPGAAACETIRPKTQSVSANARDNQGIRSRISPM